MWLHWGQVVEYPSWYQNTKVFLLYCIFFISPLKITKIHEEILRWDWELGDTFIASGQQQIVQKSLCITYATILWVWACPKIRQSILFYIFLLRLPSFTTMVCKSFFLKLFFFNFMFSAFFFLICLNLKVLKVLQDAYLLLLKVK